MHDMTNVPLMQPSDAELNRALWNAYYGGCCGKGGIFTQMCGWEGTLELFTGAIGDSDYIKLSKILKTQNDFSECDLGSNGEKIPFINIFDKGYRVLLECLNEGVNCVGNLCLQGVMKDMVHMRLCIQQQLHLHVLVMRDL